MLYIVCDQFRRLINTQSYRVYTQIIILCIAPFFSGIISVITTPFLICLFNKRYSLSLRDLMLSCDMIRPLLLISAQKHPDSILIIGDKKEAEYWKDESAQEILQAYATNMNNRGFVRVDDREEANLGLQVSYIKSTYYFNDYGRPEWWWNYPGYWDAPYWGNWGGWYYPYAVTYTYSTGSFITELLNLEATQGEKEKLPILWTSYMSGLLSGSTAVNTKLAIEGVNQAYTQSSYLTNK